LGNYGFYWLFSGFIIGDLQFYAVVVANSQKFFSSPQPSPQAEREKLLRAEI